MAFDCGKRYLQDASSVGLSFLEDVQCRVEVMLAGTLIALIPTLVVFALGQRFFTKGLPCQVWRPVRYWK